jgi:hypothetical protein
VWKQLKILLPVLEDNTGKCEILASHSGHIEDLKLV